MNAADRFWAKVDKSGDCWLWTGNRDRGGYGRFKMAERYVGAHRHVLILAGVDIGGMEVDHLCFNRACVNPDHLRVVTHKQNMENRAGANPNSKTGIRGVSWHIRMFRWCAVVKHNGRPYSKYFTDIADAEAWVIAKRLELFTHNDADRISA